VLWRMDGIEIAPPQVDCQAFTCGRRTGQYSRRWTMQTGMGMSDYLTTLAIVAILVSLWLH
jgi:hypothetical protein